MADARENPREARGRSDETESRSVKETKGRATDLRRDEKNREQRHGASSERLGSRSSSSDKSSERDLRAYPVRPREKDCQFYLETGLCLFGRRCWYNHPRHLPKEFPKRNGVKICQEHRDGAEPRYQERRRTPRSYETESGSRPKKRAKTIPDSAEPDLRERFEDLEAEEGEIREQENPQNQMQRNTESQGTERAQHNLQQQSKNETEAQHNLQFHQQQQQQQQSGMETPQSGMQNHTPQQQQQPSVKTPQQQELLASHFNLYPVKTQK
ncbi:PREDICTED: putative zinc finger CCCH domain-containing protein 9 [Camelina sativa]|uniref:Zinc finger CCCH domain-containing protein 9 n=1 Tax=Camelina sativa TaxID=90675 RepID=A0ABM0YIY4_CAMSA|nr:PREDICTED: putative zinc finger CCCH domain-containing protein 9 [Camelina sativa]